MIRDNRKSIDYFKNYIEYQKDRIRKKKEKLSTCGDDKSKAERINLSLLNFEIDLLYAEFSLGTKKSGLITFLNDAIDTATKMTKIDYESLLNLLALSVLLDNNKKAQILIKNHRDMIYKDKLLKFLAIYLKEADIKWEGEFTIPAVYGKLETIYLSDDKESVLLEYLNVWYEEHKDTSWYGSDSSNNDIYVGYWSFESAAIAKIMKITERKLGKNVYYPKL
ncbi:MAG: DUF1911 domain-containing protein [Lachnospiraceae bacterium]|nr:DUF1911 domain-containing protein [Lachnospiraceae bacterium]